MPSSSTHKRKKKPSAVRRLKDVRIDEVSLVDNPAVPDATFMLIKRDLSEERDVGVNSDKQETRVEKANKIASAFASALKALKAVAGEMDESGLQVLATVMSYAKFGLRNNEGSMPDELSGILKSCEEIEGVEAVELEKASFMMGPKGMTALGEAKNLIGSAIGSARKVGKVMKQDEQPEEEPEEEAAEEVEDETPPEAPDDAPGEVAPESSEPEEEVQKLSLFDEAALLLEQHEQDRLEMDEKAAQDAAVREEIDLIAKLTEMDGKLDSAVEGYNNLNEKFEHATGKVPA